MKSLKKLAALCLALALALSLAGCGLSPRMARSAVEMDKIGSFHMDMRLELGVALAMMGQMSSVDMTVDESMDVWRDPLAVASEIRTEVSGEAETVLGYLIPQDGGERYLLCISTDGGETWDKQSVKSDELSAHTGYSGTIDQLMLLAKAARGFKEAGRETINGVETIRYDGVIRGETVTEALTNSGIVSSLGEEFGVELDAEDLKISGSIPASVWMAESSGRILRYDMDMAEAISSVWSTIMTKLSDDETFAVLRNMGVSLTISKAKVSATLSQFDELGELELPEGLK